jgi:hypothetical protein
MTDSDDFDALIEPYHQAMRAIINGDPDVSKAMYSDREDVTPSPIPSAGWHGGGPKSRKG